MFEHEFKKQFGQNFLTNVKWIVDMLSAAEINKDDQIVEIGPGAGALTEFLIEQAQRVIAVEIDYDLVDYLREKFEQYDNFEVKNADILEVNIKRLTKNEPYKLIGALPYNISKKIIRRFILEDNKPESATFIIQKEVAKKYTAKAPKASFLSTFASIYANVEYLGTIPKGEFNPVPAVDGGILKFTNIKPKVENHVELNKFIKLGYTQPRKKLSKSLSNYGYEKAATEANLEKMGLSANARAGELTLDNWLELMKL